MDKLLNNKFFWYIFNTGTALSWIFVLAGFFNPYSGILNWLWVILVFVFGIIHPLEIMVSLPISKRRGYSVNKSIAGTILFGFGWWLPIKKNVFTSGEPQ